jgi:preprotein translocase subunit SecA
VEAYFFDQRRQLFEYDQVLNTQRDKVYGQRRRALLSKDLSKQMLEFAERTVDDILEVRSSLCTLLFVCVISVGSAASSFGP